jgi:hypothetical protein
VIFMIIVMYSVQCNTYIRKTKQIYSYFKCLVREQIWARVKRSYKLLFTCMSQSLFSSVVEHWSCKPGVGSSILSGGIFSKAVMRSSLCPAALNIMYIKICMPLFQISKFSRVSIKSQGIVNYILSRPFTFSWISFAITLDNFPNIFRTAKKRKNYKTHTPSCPNSSW